MTRSWPMTTRWTNGTVSCGNYEHMPESAVGSQAAAGLTSAARMWLGSSFCAGHILRNLNEAGCGSGVLDT